MQLNSGHFLFRATIIFLFACRGALAAAIAADSPVVHFNVDLSRPTHPISPYIYGVNNTTAPKTAFIRIGGNRWTAYNWENNASNAGADWHNQNDDYFGKSNEPGEAVKPFVDAAARNDAPLLLTIPMSGYVAADKAPAGDVNLTRNFLEARFVRSIPKKNAPFTLKPDLNDRTVYQDEFVNWIEHSARKDGRQQFWYALDNEPDIWFESHKRIHPKQLTYQEMIDKSFALAGAIKDVAPQSLVFGAVNYGWAGYRTLKDAPDAKGRDFHQFFLGEMKKADAVRGHRLIDVLDVHWYPEATGGGVRVTDKSTAPDVVAARLQAPRSLWDPTYVETSWITKDAQPGKAIAMIPRMKRDVDQFYPGTKIAFTEYDFGAGNHISGGLAQADALGVFGVQGIFAACWWDINQGSDYVDAAFAMYRDFGDSSVAARTDDIAATSIYASADSHDNSKVVVIILNKTDHPIEGEIKIAGAHTAFVAGEASQLTGDSPKIKSSGAPEFGEPNTVRYNLRAYSATSLQLHG